MFWFTFLFSPTFFWGGMSFAFWGSILGWMVEKGARGTGPPGGPASRWDFTLGSPPLSPSPSGRGAGRVEQRKGLTRKEEAVGLRILGAPLPLPHLGGSKGGEAQN